VTGWPQKVEMGYMKVTCPKCQFENQADSSRVVCARCATIIEVRMDQGFDSNGKRQTARLPFNSGGLSGGGQSLGSQRFNQSDVYATRIGDDFDDVLDVPIQPQPGYQSVDDTPPAPVFEDVFASAQNQDQASPYDFAAYDKAPGAPIDAFGVPAARQEYIEPAEQEFVGWPVMPESPEEEEEAAGSGRGGLFLRLGLIVGLFGVLCVWAYYFLPDFIAKRRAAREKPTVETVASSGGASEPAQPADPQVAPATGEDKTPAGGNQTPPEPPPPQNNRASDDRVGAVPPLKAEGGARPPQGGTTLVKPPPRAAGASNRSGLTIQVGSFRDQGEADARASSLNAATDGAFHVVEASIPSRGLWYRVQKVEGFGSREAALSYGNRLRGRNLISDFIVTTR